MYSGRITALFAIFAAALAAVVVNLFYLQIVRGEAYRDYAERQRVVLLPKDVARARILTSDGCVLAEDSLVFDISVVIGRLDPANERLLRDPLRRLFFVRRNARLVRVLDAGWQAARTEAGVVISARSSLEIETKDAKGKPHTEVAERREEFALTSRITQAIEWLARMSGESFDAILKRTLDAAMDVARMRMPVFRAVPVLKNVNYEIVAAVETGRDALRGFAVTTRYERAMPAGPLAPHLVGYLSKFDERDVEAAMAKYHGWPGRHYFIGLMAGKSGIEQAMDAALRGDFGLECIERDNMNQRQAVLADAPPVPGRDVVLTLDSRLQKIVENAMHGKVGAVVMIDVETGNILAIASVPNFDPARIGADFPALSADPDHPLFNRAIAGNLPLGSVFKTVTLLAALERNQTPPAVECAGSVRYGNRVFRCNSTYGHGTVNVTDALKVSCNVYLYKTAERVGDAAIIEMARQFGFGKLTDIGIAGERAGILPQSAQGGELLNLSIGQGGLTATPLQVARLMAALSNGGVLVPPRIVQELRPFDYESSAAESVPDERRPVRLSLSQSSLNIIRTGLYEAVNERGGTALRAFEGFARPFRLCGKTSTAQRRTLRGHQAVVDNVGWFAGYAPADRPRVAFVVAVERLSGNEGGGSVVAPIARKIFDEIPLDLLGLGGRR